MRISGVLLVVVLFSGGCEQDDDGNATSAATGGDAGARDASEGTAEEPDEGERDASAPNDGGESEQPSRDAEDEDAEDEDAEDEDAKDEDAKDEDAEDEDAEDEDAEDEDTEDEDAEDEDTEDAEDDSTEASEGDEPETKEGEKAESSDAVTADADALTYYAHAKPIIDAKCGICHFDEGIAPMSLTTYEEVEPLAGLIKYDVEAEIMPPWLPSDPRGKYVGDRRLTEEQKTTLIDWIDGGALEGDPQNEPSPLPVEGKLTLDRVDVSLEMAEAYTPQVDPDDYRCFVLDWPYESTKYVTALEVLPGDRKLVHHAIVYYVEPANVPSVLDRDAWDWGPGYQCFGGSPGPASWLTSYEPGGHADEIPGELGFSVEPGSKMVLQVHYNTLNGTGSDKSRINFTVEDEVDRVGDVHLIMDWTWFTGAMTIPAGEPDVVHSYTGRGVGLNALETYEIFWVDLHMHALGSSGRIGIERAGGDFVELLNIPAWDFAWQETFILREPVTLFPGDDLYVECHFDNTAGNQVVVDGVQLPPRNVAWGDGTTDEMCLGNVLVAPAQSE
ncbi:MAG: monooxygenase [Myxococcales bacterium]|nr:monooxygenase [Myxococcales bacterium]